MNVFLLLFKIILLLKLTISWNTQLLHINIIVFHLEYKNCNILKYLFEIQRVFKFSHIFSLKKKVFQKYISYI